MKRNHKTCLIMLGVGLLNAAHAASPTATTCKEVFGNYAAQKQCTSYSISTSKNADGSMQYICQCDVCDNGYHLSSDGSRYANVGVSMMMANGCAKDDASGPGGSGTERPTQSSCSTGKLCTSCRGPYVTINGQIYCGIWANTKQVNSCDATTVGAASANSAYLMSPCCDSDGYAVGGATGCYIMGCKTGMVVADGKTSCVCNIGYYGTTTTGCTRCPPEGGIYGLTAAKGKTKKTDCFFPAGMSIKDTSGTYEYTEDCYYTE